MSISHQYFSERFVEYYVKTPLSLKDQAMTKLAIQLCQNSEVKRHILCDSKRLRRAVFSGILWDDLLEKQSFKSCEKLDLPNAIKSPLILRIRSIAIEILIWNRKYRVMLRTQDADSFLTSYDWTTEGRINEGKVAMRLVQDERIAVWLRYQIACVNCLESFIRFLWNQIPAKYREECCCSFNKGCIRHSMLVRSWSDYVTNSCEGLDTFTYYHRIFESAINEGERTAVIYCWKILREYGNEEVIMFAAYNAQFLYQIRMSKCWMIDIIENDKWCAPPAHYSDIAYFFLSQMSDVQIVAFFKDLLNRLGLSCVAEPRSKSHEVFPCFIDSPYRNYFVSIINKLWESLSERDYGAILLIVAEKYANSKNIKEYQVLDYGELLIELLKQTPENYKRYIFKDKRERGRPGTINEGKKLLLNVLKRQPFVQKNIELMQDILKHSTMEEKRSIIDSQCGRELCKILIENKTKETADLILADCFSKVEIFHFKKKFIRSREITCYCFEILEKENEESLISLLNWACYTKEEILNFKTVLIHAPDCREEIQNLLFNFQMDRVDRVLEWCLPSDVDRQKFKNQFVVIKTAKGN